MMAARLLLLMVLFTPLSVAEAGSLVRLHATPSEHVYVDQDTIEAKDGRVTIWSLWNLASPRNNSFDETYHSVRLKNEYDCQRRTVRVVEVVEFAAPMAEGQALRTYSDYAHKTDTVPTGSLGEKLFDLACTRQAASGF